MLGQMWTTVARQHPYDGQRILAERKAAPLNDTLLASSPRADALYCTVLYCAVLYSYELVRCHTGRTPYHAKLARARANARARSGTNVLTSSWYGPVVTV